MTIMHFKDEAVELVGELLAMLDIDVDTMNDKAMLATVGYVNRVLTRVANDSYDQGVEDGPVDYQ